MTTSSEHVVHVHADTSTLEEQLAVFSEMLLDLGTQLECVGNIVDDAKTQMAAIRDQAERATQLDDA